MELWGRGLEREVNQWHRKGELGRGWSHMHVGAMLTETCNLDNHPTPSYAN